MSVATTEVLRAIAEPSRYAIVELLRGGARPVGQIATALGIRQPHASRHLRILAEAGVVSARTAAQSRIYRLEPAAFDSLGQWLDTFAGIWADRADRLDAYLEQVADEQDEEQ